MSRARLATGAAALGGCGLSQAAALRAAWLRWAGLYAPAAPAAV
ncbi:hypothetical protein [Arthrobacter sp. Leaf69]|nr:hypothetical protein [Arthrobacter sp. Leaf69]